MKVELVPTVTIKGYRKLSGISHLRIKAVARNINTSLSNRAIEIIRKRNGHHRCEYRLIKEPKGFIFRETLADSGISGHHKTIKSAIISALKFVTIHIDEDFNYSEFSEFKTVEEDHRIRNEGTCNHSLLNSAKYCLNCGLRIENIKS